VKLFCLFILLINISFFFWEYRKGAPDIYQPQAIVARANGGGNKHQILLLSELQPAENNTEQMVGIATAVVVTNIEKPFPNVELEVIEQTIAEHDGLLAEVKLPGLNSNTALSVYLATEFIPPLDEQHSLTALLTDTPIKQSSPALIWQPDKSILLAIKSYIDSFYQHNGGFRSLDTIDVEGAKNIPATESQADFIGPPLPEIFATTVEPDVRQQQHNMALAIGTARPEKSLDVQLTDSFSMASLKQYTTCYLLQKSQYKEEMLALAIGDGRYKLKFFDQEQEYISSYLVLTNAADSLLVAKERLDSIKAQGIKELWLFRQGEFKWRISLGLFSTKVKAMKARNNYARQITQGLNIVPSVRKKKTTLVRVASENKIMTNFESKFSVFIEKKVDCTASE
jgi:hypothetical protein